MLRIMSKPYNYIRAEIKTSKRDNLRISWDDEDGFILLFTPDMGNTDIHYHILLSDVEAKQLSSFIEKKLFELRAELGNQEKDGEIY